MVSALSLSAQTNQPVIISQADSTRAIALEAVTQTPEPFSSTGTSSLYGADKRTRLLLLVQNLALQPGEDISAIGVNAEDASRRPYQLKVEYLGTVPGLEWISQIILRVDENIDDVGDVALSLTYRGVVSNRVLISFGRIGAYTISGQVRGVGSGLDGVPVTLKSNSGEFPPRVVNTSGGGNFSFLGVRNGYDYVVTPAQTTFYDFDSREFRNLFGNQTVNLTGKLRSYSVTGLITNEANAPLSNIAVQLSSTNGPVSKLAITGTDGRFTFTDVTAAYTYLVAPYETVLHRFTLQTIRDLDANQTINFGGTKKTYTISGVVADPSQKGVAGVDVLLTGSSTKRITTDASGSYSFNSLPAGGSYQVAVSKLDHIFNAQTQTYGFLGQDEKTNYTATRIYRISGRVTSSSGRGLGGITMSVRGAETGATTTDSDGSYTLIVKTIGDYVLTPSKEQSFNTFFPANRSLPGLNAHQTADFTADSYVLDFDGKVQNVDFGSFWPEGIDLPKFFWEFWAMPGENAYSRYLLSDGYGGAHALLFGFFSAGDPQRYSLYGNIYTGAYSIAFNSDDGPAPGEWGHLAVSWDGRYISTYFNGVPVGRTPFVGPRRTYGPAGGGGSLYIGGSEHNNLIGRIAQVRGFEGSNPLEDVGGNRRSTSAFAPETFFKLDNNYGNSKVSFLANFFKPGRETIDQANNRTGYLRGGTDIFFLSPPPPLSKFIIDPTAPSSSSFETPPATVDKPKPAPVGARAFDSFSRRSVTLAFNERGGLGSTEGGSGGALAWRSGSPQEKTAGPPIFGILNGRAVVLSDGPAIAWVNTTSSTGSLDLRVDKRPGGGGSGIFTGLCFRVKDGSNFFFAYTTESLSNPSSAGSLTIGYYLDGVRSNLSVDVAMPESWVTLRVVTLSSGQIEVYAENELIYSTTSGLLSAEKGAGLYHDQSGQSLTSRWDNFTVLDAP